MRERAGFTQAELAHRLGVSEVTVRNIERGDSGSHLSTLKAWADLCDSPLWSAFVDDAGPDELLARWSEADPQTRAITLLVLDRVPSMPAEVQAAMMAMLSATAAP